MHHNSNQLLYIKHNSGIYCMYVKILHHIYYNKYMCKIIKDYSTDSYYPDWTGRVQEITFDSYKVKEIDNQEQLLACVL